MKVALILQAFGLGDQIFAQAIAHHFLSQGYHVIWPVKPNYVEALQRAYPKVCFISDEAVKREYFDIKEKIEIDGMLIVPIRWSDSYMKKPYKEVMRAKFDMYDLDWKEWKEYAMWRRDSDKELQLFKHLGLHPERKFNLINKKFAANGQKEMEINVMNGHPNIEMIEIPGYSLFDWARVIQSAITIHTVSTSILYMLELLDLSAKEVHLYPRKPIENDFSFVEYLFTKDYKLHL